MAEKKSKKSTVKDSGYVPAFKVMYQDKVVSELMSRYNYKSVSQVPKVEKITLNMGIGDAKNNQKALESAVQELEAISGQKAVITKARQDISNFKIRRGFPVGCMVTLRGPRMYEFLERLTSIALPRSRDFRGLSHKAFDGRGNYSFGIQEQIIFTEIDYDKIDAIRGLNIVLTTSAKTNDEAYWLLKGFGFPLREKPVKKEKTEAA